MSKTNFKKDLQTGLDIQMTERSTTGWMEENAGQVIYGGGKEIKIPALSMQGLGTYNREEGYASGAVTFSYETMTMSQDRGRRLRLDAMEVNDDCFENTAARVAEQFQREKVIPEVDAYRYSKLAGLAGVTKEYIPSDTTVYGELLAQLGQLSDITGGEGELVVAMSRPVYDKLLASDDIVKVMETGALRQGEIDVEVKKLNGAVIVPVPSARMKSDYDFAVGAEGGFAPKADAADINWIICPKNVPIAVAKTDNVKIIAPENNPFADAWDVDYRKYHELVVPANKKQYIIACLNK